MIVFSILLVFAEWQNPRVHADETSTISAQQTRMQSMLDQVVAQADHTLLRQPARDPANSNRIPETVASIVALDPVRLENWPFYRRLSVKK
jgi:hypothetical protein